MDNDLLRLLVRAAELTPEQIRRLLELIQAERDANMGKHRTEGMLDHAL